MRRKDHEITDPKILTEVLATAQVCRLAMVADGEPYLVPHNFGFRDNVLYFHSAPAGRKIDALHRNNRVCFEVESSHEIVRDSQPCDWGVKVRSVVGYGRVEFVDDLREKQRALDVIMAQHGKTDANVYDPRLLEAVTILRLQIESMAGKQLGRWD
jgi:nitroimidazol reductase NimA-like FMN-containing flavoprotein (pyridoxamine 5'-phosphate oxidase superfamily)